MNAGLRPGSAEWAQAIQSHYSLDADVSALCEAYTASLKTRQSYEARLIKLQKDRNALNVLAAHVTELAEQMSRAVKTMMDMTKEKVDGEETR